MPPFDPQKFPFNQNLNWFAEDKIDDAQSLLSKSWPVTVVEVLKNNAIVKVKIDLRTDYKFPILTVPVASPQYIRQPIQEGDKGVVFCCQYATWGVTGLGTSEGVPDLAPQFNTSNGVFFPVGNRKFEDVEDQKALLLYGPGGVVLRSGAPAASPAPPTTRANVPGVDTGSKLVITEEKGFEFYINGMLKFVIDAAGARYVGNEIPGMGGATYGINTTDTGTHIDNINYLTHIHEGVQPGAGNSGDINTIVSPVLRKPANEDEP